jgi:predicted small lipoprotein YifL
MRALVWLVVLLLFPVAAGCGSKPTALPPLTDEQKAKIKQEDQQTEEAEHSGSGKSTRKKTK